MSASNAWQPLAAVQTCFVVSDMDEAVRRAEEEFGWGPFLRFSAPSRGSDGREGTTHVALGNAGRAQVEFVALENVDDTIGEYQARYGSGFQHLGVFCRDIDAARAALGRIGAATRQTGDHPGIRFAFLDAPTGTGMIELLQPDENVPTPEKPPRERAALAIDSATLVTADLASALQFFGHTFGWDELDVTEDTLELDGAEVGTANRASGQAGLLRLEFVEPLAGDNLYTRHLAQRDHGLVHVGAVGTQNPASRASGQGRWIEGGERFCFLDTPFARHGVRLALAGES
jgi:catechol 2,3-dioxygenase-like lactoylglutathione lyase family enzyme